MAVFWLFWCIFFYTQQKHKRLQATRKWKVHTKFQVSMAKLWHKKLVKTNGSTSDGRKSRQTDDRKEV